VISGGKPGYDRLLLLARERWADTRALLKRAGVAAGMRCADLGCGAGEVSMAIPPLVAPDGSVVGVDVDEVKLGLARRGGDHAIGRKLCRHFRAAGITDPQVSLVQPVHQGEAKALALSTLEATADAILAEGVATAGQVTAALASLRQFTDDPGTLICGPRVFQLWSRR
jgi:predicted methyltransferase